MAAEHTTEAPRQRSTAPLVTFTLYDNSRADGEGPSASGTASGAQAPLPPLLADLDASARQQQADNIREEVLRSPLVDVWRPLAEVAAEYADSNAAFHAKLLDLVHAQVTRVRRVRGDGNCFYRCVLLGLLEGLASTPAGRRKAAVERVRAAFSRIKETLSHCYQECVTEDPLLLLSQLLDAAADGTLTAATLHDRFQDEQQQDIMYVLFLLRMCASSEVMSRSEHYYPVCCCWRPPRPAETERDSPTAALG